ncbi:MAG TPA: hypothetical protein VHQ66_09390, partial [Myxococcota bacterium]|nr:hypothetical protein [Myxococcota bacterium]
RRPSGGAAALLLADAAGDAALVELAGAERRVLRPRDGLLVAAEGERAVELAKACASLRGGSAEALAGALAAPRAPGAPARAALVLDPVARRLSLRSDGGRWVHASL